MSNNNSIKIKDIVSENSIIIYNDSSYDYQNSELKINNINNLDKLNDNKYNKNIKKFNVNDKSNINSNIKSNIKNNINESFNSFKKFIKCKNNKSCKFFRCFKCCKYKYNTALHKFFNNKKLFIKENDLIISNLKKQLYHNLYELKKDLFLYKIRLNKNNINQIIYFLSNNKEVGYSDYIKINTKSVIQIEDIIEFNNSILNLIKQTHSNNYNNYNKYCVFAKIVDLNIDHLENNILQSDIDNLNDTIQIIPIIVNSLFMYKTNYDSLFNHNVPENLKSHTNQNFLISFDDSINSDSKVCHNSEYLKKLHSKY